MGPRGSWAAAAVLAHPAGGPPGGGELGLGQVHGLVVQQALSGAVDPCRVTQPPLQALVDVKLALVVPQGIGEQPGQQGSGRKLGDDAPFVHHGAAKAHQGRVHPQDQDSHGAHSRMAWHTASTASLKDSRVAPGRSV